MERQRERQREREREREREFIGANNNFIQIKAKALGHRKKTVKQVVSLGAPRQLFLGHSGTGHVDEPSLLGSLYSEKCLNI